MSRNDLNKNEFHTVLQDYLDLIKELVKNNDEIIELIKKTNDGEVKTELVKLSSNLNVTAGSHLTKFNQFLVNYVNEK